MKFNLKYFTIACILLLAGMVTYGQLPSERPMSAIAPKLLKSGPPASQPTAAELPGNNKMREVKTPPGKMVKGSRSDSNADPSKLPSNSKRPVKEMYRKPKRKT